jgi:hypothetical protein
VVLTFLGLCLSLFLSGLDQLGQFLQERISGFPFVTLTRGFAVNLAQHRAQVTRLDLEAS